MGAFLGRICLFVYLRVQKSNALTGINELLLSHFAASLCLFQSCPQLLNFTTMRPFLWSTMAACSFRSSPPLTASSRCSWAS